ncbi:hypothetical protein EN918_20620 [Mesorhizobium sp. M7A.F.Ca.CA.004.05.1.1]|nr:hypothetical protein EN918_20620 [Mesorhizobium sp. M7A.F.Ca.CA.004.05.1.1]
MKTWPRLAIRYSGATGRQRTAWVLQSGSRQRTAARCLRWRFRFRTELPMTVTGKPQKFLMREAMVEQLGLVAQKTA